MELKVLRKVKTLDASTAEFINGQDGFYGDGSYVDNDYPRDTVVAEEIVAATVSFAVADENGVIIRDDIPTLVEAERLKNSAEVTFNVNVKLPESVPAGE